MALGGSHVPTVDDDGYAPIARQLSPISYRELRDVPDSRIDLTNLATESDQAHQIITDLVRPPNLHRVSSDLHYTEGACLTQGRWTSKVRRMAGSGGRGALLGTGA